MNWSSTESIDITYRLLNIRGFGSVKTNKILWSLHTLISTPDQYESLLLQTLSPSEIQMFTTHKDLRSRNQNVNYISVLDESRYPKKLIETLKHSTPPILTYIGNLELLNKASVGFSGSRKVSEKGLWITRDSVSQLVKNDICIISGYANGVDLEAHRTALQNGGSTIIVLPEGIESFYIRNQLKDIWDWNRVLVISEFMPDDKWKASRAMQRNQTIIGLSDGLLVIEAGETGGSIDAGMKAMNLGKKLYVPYYKDLPESAIGNNTLIKMGANKLYKKQNNHTNVDSIIESIRDITMHNCTLPFAQ